MHTIYAIYIPETESIIYVGQTCNLEQRIKSHLNTANTIGLLQLTDSLKKVGQTVEFKILETCDASNKNEREIYWIDKCISEGHKLRNVTFVVKRNENTKLMHVAIPLKTANNLQSTGKTKYMSFSQYVNSLIDKDLTDK